MEFRIDFRVDAAGVTARTFFRGADGAVSVARHRFDIAGDGSMEYSRSALLTLLPRQQQEGLTRLKALPAGED